MAEAQPLYRQMVEALDPYVDLFICETMSSTREARNAASMARRHSTKPVYVSWTLAEAAGAGLRSGESVAAALDGVADLAPDALLFNCTSPQAIAGGLAQLAELTDQPLGAYPNRFSVPEGWTLDGDKPTERYELSVEDFVNHALRWRELGASPHRWLLRHRPRAHRRGGRSIAVGLTVRTLRISRGPAHPPSDP